MTEAEEAKVEDIETQRLVLCVGYLGDKFHGSQLQPDVRTVQGELEKALKKLEWLDSDLHIWISSRTDAGVHVRMNLASFDMPTSRWSSIGENNLLRALNDRLPDDVFVWGAYAVSDDVIVRMARRRVYLYRFKPYLAGQWMYLLNEFLVGVECSRVVMISLIFAELKKIEQQFAQFIVVLRGLIFLEE